MDEQELLEKYGARAAALRREAFLPLLNGAFVYHDANGNRYELVLTEVEEGKRNKGLFDSFTLVFTSPREVFFPQGYFLLEQETLGELPLLLTPALSLDRARNSYCAYFSHPHDQ